MDHPGIDEPPSLEGYNVLDKIGFGAYSTVYKAVELATEEEVAIKCVLKSNLSKSGANNIVQEIKIMKMLQNEFILKLRDFQYDNRYVFLILDYCDGGDLSTFIKTKKRVPEKICKIFMQQLILGLKFLRSKNITHFDLKPQNLLLVTKPALTLKIADFGLSGFLSDQAKIDVLKGSPRYMAPEILLETSADAKADLWSVGVIFYECLFGEAPLAFANCRQLVKRLTSEAPINIPPGLAPDTRDLLKRLLEIKPEVRICFEDLFEHPFLDLEHYPRDETYVKAVALARDAVKLDFEKKYVDAFNMYCACLNYLVPFLHTTLSTEKEMFIHTKVQEYFRRAEQLKSVLFKTPNYMTSLSDAKRVTETNLTNGTTDLTVDQLVTRSRTMVTSDGDIYGSKFDDKFDEKFEALKTMCLPTPKLVDALEIGIAAQMYLYEGNYESALTNYKTSLNILVLHLEREPPGVRKSLLTKLIKEWLREAESAKALISATEETGLKIANTMDDGCVIQ